MIDSLAASLWLIVTYPVRYPEERAVVEVRWSGLQKGLIDMQYAVLQSILEKKENLFCQSLRRLTSISLATAITVVLTGIYSS
jgi:hypothetical protein